MFRSRSPGAFAAIVVALAIMPAMGGVAQLNMPARAQDYAAATEFAASKAWFNGLPREDRRLLQFFLIWMGTYNGLVDGEFGPRTFEALRAFQNSIDTVHTGALTTAELTKLIDGAEALMRQVDFRIVTDQRAGIQVGLPQALLLGPHPTPKGSSWRSADGKLEVETSLIPYTERSTGDLFARLSSSTRQRRVEYKVAKPSFFVVSGTVGDKFFYLRFMAGSTGTAGFSVAWEPQVMFMSRVVTAMSNTLGLGPAGPEATVSELDTATTIKPHRETEPSLSTGTGFFVSASGHIITNNHVVDGCAEIRIRPADGRLEDASLVARAAQDDLALLKTDRVPSSLASFRSGRSIRLGETVIVFGFPLVGQLSSSGVLTSGQISALAGPRDDPSYLQMSAPVQSGNSGGPLVDQAGNVVGVVTAKGNLRVSADGGVEVFQNMNFAVKSSVVANLLDAHDVAYNTAESKEAKATPDLADTAKQFTVLVVCRR